MLHDIKINTKWLYSALNNLANDYIIISEFDEAFKVIEELTNILMIDYNEYKRHEDDAIASEIKTNFKFYLQFSYFFGKINMFNNSKYLCIAGATFSAKHMYMRFLRMASSQMVMIIIV